MIASGHTNIHVPSRRIRFACWISVDLIEPSAFFALYYQVIITILSIVEPENLPCDTPDIQPVYRYYTITPF